MEKLVGRDCGEEVAEWLLKFFGKPHRLVYATPDLHNRQLCTSGMSQFHKKARPDDRVGYCIRDVTELVNELQTCMNLPRYHCT